MNWPVARAEALVVSEVFPPAPGGSGQLLANVYSRLIGIPVTVFTEPAPEFDLDSVESYRIIREPMRTAHWGVLNIRGLLGHFARARRIRDITAGRPTVVHCARLLPEGLAAWFARMRGGSRYVCWAHGEELGYVAASRELNWLAARVCEAAECVIANSRNTAKRLAAFGADETKIRIIRPGVDHERFRPGSPGGAGMRSRLAPPGAVVLLTVGRLQHRKGQDLVLRAIADWSAEDRPVHYVIVGDGDDRARLERLTMDLSLERCVTFAGAVPDAELPAYYGAADLFVHPNRTHGSDFEGFGLVFLEAAASGLAAVGGSSGGVPEAVEDGVTGTLVSGTSAAELLGVLQHLVRSPERRRSMGKAARARVVAQFSWARAAAQVQGVHSYVAGLDSEGIWTSP